MKRFTFILLSIFLLITLAACNGGETPPESDVLSTPPSGTEGTVTPAENTPTTTTQTLSNDTEESTSKILIAYFSSAGNIVTDEEPRGNVGHGNTKTIADMIQKQIGGDLFFIETVDKYPANYNDTIDVAMRQQRSNARPELKTRVENMEDYDVIFIGYPNWWGDMPMVLYTFLEAYDFSSKTIVPFNTHGGSGFSRTISTIADLQPDATVITDGYSVSRNNVESAEDDVVAWLVKLGYGLE